MPEQPSCACQESLKLVFACSGAADVGAIADQAARKISHDGLEDRPDRRLDAFGHEPLDHRLVDPSRRLRRGFCLRFRLLLRGRHLNRRLPRLCGRRHARRGQLLENALLLETPLGGAERGLLTKVEDRLVLRFLPGPVDAFFE